MWKEAQTARKSRQPKRQKSLELVQSRQSLTTVRQEVSGPPYRFGFQIRPNKLRALGFHYHKLL